MLLITRLLIDLFLKGGGTRGVTDALHRVGQSLQNSNVQTVLAPARLPTAPLPTAPLSVTRSANPSLRGGNGQLRLCNVGCGLSTRSMPSPTHSMPYRQPSTSSYSTIHGRGQLQLLQNPTRSHPYYNPRQTYVAASTSGNRSRRRPSTCSRAHQAPLGRVPLGRKFSKNIVLVSSDEEVVPKGRRRQNLHEAGALIHSVNFFTNWTEAEVRVSIERALGGVLDDLKPQPRYMHG